MHLDPYPPMIGLFGITRRTTSVPDMRIMPILRASGGFAAVTIMPAVRIVTIVPLASIVPILTAKQAFYARSLTAR